MNCKNPKIWVLGPALFAIVFYQPERFGCIIFNIKEPNVQFVLCHIGGSRGLVLGRLWRRDGVLAVSCSQEGVLRVKPVTQPKL